MEMIIGSLFVTCVLLVLTATTIEAAFVSSTAPRTTPKFRQPICRLTGGIAENSKTALHMGLGSFLKKKVLGRKDRDDDDEFSDPEDDERLPEMFLGNEGDNEAGMIDDEFTGEEPIRYGRESIQDKVKRIQAGEMTEEEKAAFLQTALTASSTKEDDRKKPLRQRIPAPDDPEPKQRKEPASPMPRDTLIKNTFRTPRRQENLSAGRSRARQRPELDSDRKKREYLQMVTNPNRFKAYVTPSTTEEPSSPIDSFLSDDDDDETDKSTAFKTATGGADLGSRLGAAATAEEKRKKQMMRQQEIARQNQRQKLAEMQRQRNEEIARREAEALERKRRQEEAERRAEEERQRAEEEQRRKLMEAQENYWNQKLEKERASQRKILSDEMKEKAAKEEERLRERKEHELKEEQERVRLREAERLREDPHEGELLQKAEETKTHDREATWKIVEGAAAKVKGTEPSRHIPDLSTSSILDEKDRQSAEIEKRKRDQLDRLKSLNSPLPSPRKGTGAAPSATPVMQQQRSVSNAPDQGNRLSLRDLTKMNSQQTTTGKDASPNSKLSLQELTQLKNSDEGDARNQNGNGDGDLSRDPDSQKGSNLLGRFLGSQKKTKKTENPADVKVVRQPLPSVDDEDDDDFHTFSRGGPNKKMSIAEAMKKSKAKTDGRDEDPQARSKRWGIDMSKYQDK